MYLVIGGSGFLGRYIVKNILELTQDKVIATYSSNKPNESDTRVDWQQLDINDYNAVKELSKKLEPNTKVIYLAAYHHPDKVEENPELAWEKNIIALANIVNILTNIKCFYYASTDSVYGEGSKDLKFLETSPLNPVNTYGKQKVLAEQITIAKGYNVVRYPFIVGASLVDGRKHFFDYIKADLESGKVVEMFDDSYRSTLDFNQCAKILIEIIEKFGSCEEKILNIAADKALSKYEFALFMAEKLNLDKNLIKPISVKQTQAIFKAKRASCGVLDNTKLKNLLEIKEIRLEL